MNKYIEARSLGTATFVLVRPSLVSTLEAGASAGLNKEVFLLPLRLYQLFLSPRTMIHVNPSTMVYREHARSIFDSLLLL